MVEHKGDMSTEAESHWSQTYDPMFIMPSSLGAWGL